MKQTKKNKNKMNYMNIFLKAKIKRRTKKKLKI